MYDTMDTLYIYDNTPSMLMSMVVPSDVVTFMVGHMEGSCSLNFAWTHASFIIPHVSSLVYLAPFHFSHTLFCFSKRNIAESSYVHDIAWCHAVDLLQ